MYVGLLTFHGYLRWVVLALLVAVVVRAWAGRRSGRPFTSTDHRVGVALVAAVDVQLVAGLLLMLVYSPLTSIFLSAPGAHMKDSILRFFAMEHPTMMIIAVLLIHVGRVRIKRAGDDPLRHRRALVYNLIALVIVITSIPWPGFYHARPLLRGLGV